MGEKDSYGHVLKYTGIFGGVQGLNILLGLVRNKLVALLLGPAGMGLVALYTSAICFISQASNLGISFSGVKYISEVFESGDEEKIRRYVNVIRTWSLVCALAGMLVCMAFGLLVSGYIFPGDDHTVHFLCLSPIIAFMAITGGETAILKGIRQLKNLAVIQVVTVVMSIIITVPIYYFFGVWGIIPVLVMMAFVTMVATLNYSLRAYPLQVHGKWWELGGGAGMVRLGLAFIISGIMGSGAEIVIRSYLKINANFDTIGLYNAGYVLTVTYAGMVFSAMDSDYFPRLSSISHDLNGMALSANRQIEVSLLIISPMLAVLTIALPLIMPLLYSSSFAGVIPMAQVAVFSMYLKALSLPVAYITLARGDSLAYICQEVMFDVAMVAFVIIGYGKWGLWGTGVGLTASYVVDFAIIYFYARVRYGYRMSAGVVRCALLQLPLGIAAYSVTFIHSDMLYVMLGGIVIMVSLFVSVYVLYKKTSLWNKLKSKFFMHV